jgi:hypothetical protein
MSNLLLNIPPNLKVTQEQFALLAAANRDVQLELTPTSLSGEDVLPGFVLDLQVVFS